jgi:hypothetical protein
MVRNRKFATFTINKDVLIEFNSICEKMSINKSRLIEKLVKSWMLEKSNAGKRTKTF